MSGDRASVAPDWPIGYDRVQLDMVDSTNAEAARRAPGLTQPTWICARQQTMARGRRGRPWANPPGNLAATLVLRADADPALRALRSFVAAVALREALDALTGCGAALALKWPNDVLLNGGKAAGILLEGLGSHHLAIGIGVNLIAAPEAGQVEPGALRPVSVLSETGLRLTPEAMLHALALAYARHEAQFTTWGFAPIRSAWLHHAARLGDTITARTGRDTHTGIFETVDDDGQLVLKTPEGRVTIAAADVFF